jgi:PKD domain-containing protein/peptidase M28-like protein
MKARVFLVVGAVAATLAVPVALTGSATADPAAQQRPVVDNEFLYRELYHLATQYIFRVAGSDGPLSDYNSPDNLPKNYNGAQEFYKWFGAELTNSDADHMGPLGKFMTAKDHLYPTRTWQLDDESVTIPGQSCPGRVVLIAGHNDSTPTSTNVAAGAQNGSPTPMSAMRSGNWGNGSGYDAGSGEAMGMAEMQAVLRWHAANGTYPKRTMKIGLFDNEEGGLVGSAFYSQTNVTSLSAPVLAGASNIRLLNVQGTGLGAGQTVVIDPLGTPEVRTITNNPGAATVPTTLAAAAAIGDTNVKVVSTAGMAANRPLVIDTGASQEIATIQTVGSAGPAGTGVTVSAPLTKAHAAGAELYDAGAGGNLNQPLSASHTLGALVMGGAGGLIPDGPQGQYVMVANMDQNGIEYPARHMGTEHYLNNIVGGGVGPWYTNINAIPLYTTPNNLYNATAIKRIQNNLGNAVAFRAATADAVSEAFDVLGQKYNFSMPLENPLRLDQVGSTPVDPGPASVPAYLQSDIPKYSPVVDDNTGRTDQVSFIRDWGIPGYGIIGTYDSSTNPQVGGNENPYPASYVNKPTLNGLAGYDRNDDTMQTNNYLASGTTHGPGGVDTPSEGLKRGLELPATWTSYLIAKDQYGGAETKTDSPVAYFETEPAKPYNTSTVTFDAGFSRASDGSTAGVRYFWDFGDGTMVATTNQKVTHVYSSDPKWYDVKLVVNKDDTWDYYRQALAVRFIPAHFPEAPLANEPAPPNTDPCGSLTAAEQAKITGYAKLAFPGLSPERPEVPFVVDEHDTDVSGSVPPTLSLSLGPAVSLGGFTPGVARDYDGTLLANVVSTAGEAQLSVADPSPTSTGHLVNGAFALPSALQVGASSPGGTGAPLTPLGGSANPTPLLTYGGPISNDPVTVAFRQHIGATDPLRTGVYSKTLTFTLSTSTP